VSAEGLFCAQITLHKMHLARSSPEIVGFFWISLRSSNECKKVYTPILTIIRILWWLIYFKKNIKQIKKSLLPSIVKLKLLLVWFSYRVGNNLNCLRHTDSFLPQSGCCPVQSLIVSACPVTTGIFSTRPFSHQSHLVWFLRKDVMNGLAPRVYSWAMTFGIDELPTASNWIPGGLAIPEAPTAAPSWGNALGNGTCKQATEN
jgi:hypothetical protein